MSRRWVPVLAAALVAAGCAPKQIHERPIIQQGDRTAASGQVAAAAAGDLAQQQAQVLEQRAAATARALGECAPPVCAAILRGELALGMTREQLLAATHTTPDAWTMRDAGAGSVVVPRSLDAAPKDVIGEIAIVQLRDGRVATYGYREAPGVRVVASPGDATPEARAAARADMLVREGDDLVARGALDQALARYDRAQVLKASDPLIDYRIATVLDKTLRPIEALVRYQLFLHRLDLETIKAQGEANAQLAQAIAEAQRRVIVLEKQR